MKQPETNKPFWRTWMGVFGVALLPALLATLPPFLGVEGRAVVMNAFAPFCHQMPSRSPHLLGVQLAVGHRTYGMLIGLALGSLAVLFLLRWTDVLDRYMPRVLAAAALPDGRRLGPRSTRPVGKHAAEPDAYRRALWPSCRLLRDTGPPANTGFRANRTVLDKRTHDGKILPIVLLKRGFYKRAICKVNRD